MEKMELHKTGELVPCLRALATLLEVLANKRDGVWCTNTYSAKPGEDQAVVLVLISGVHEAVNKNRGLQTQ